MADTRRFWVALVCSLALHMLALALVAALLNEPPDMPRMTIDSAVLDHGPMTIYLEGSQPKARPSGPMDDFPSEQELQHVNVEPVKASPSGPGTVVPQVDTPSGPGTVNTGTGQGGMVNGAFFGTAIQARSVVYLIDRSMSMGVSGALATARSQLLTSLRHLPPETRFQVLLYNGSAIPLKINGQYGLQMATKETIDAVAKSIEEVRGEGTTNHVQALQSGLRMEPDVMFLVSDADDLSPKDVQGITRLNNGRTSIHTVDLGTGRGFASSLRQLASDNRGSYVRKKVEE